MRVYRNTTLSFGLVTIPVCVFTSKKQEDVKLTVCDQAGTPLNRVYMTSDGEALSEDETYRSHESTVFDKSTIDALKHEARYEDGQDLTELAIQHFIPLARVPFNRVEGCFYIGPKGDSENVKRAFVSIIQAMEHEGVAAVCKWMPQTRQKLLVLYPQDGMLMGVTLCFAREVIEPGDELDMSGVTTIPAEVDVATQLIGALYDHEAEMIENAEDTAITKLRGLLRQTPDLPERQPRDQTAMVPDLMAALQASLDQTKTKKAKKAKA